MQVLVCILLPALVAAVGASCVAGDSSSCPADVRMPADAAAVETYSHHLGLVQRQASLHPTSHTKEHEARAAHHASLEERVEYLEQLAGSSANNHTHNVKLLRAPTNPCASCYNPEGDGLCTAYNVNPYDGYCMNPGGSTTTQAAAFCLDGGPSGRSEVKSCSSGNPCALCYNPENDGLCGGNVDTAMKASYGMQCMSPNAAAFCLDGGPDGNENVESCTSGNPCAPCYNPNGDGLCVGYVDAGGISYGPTCMSPTATAYCMDGGPSGKEGVTSCSSPTESPTVSPTSPPTSSPTVSPTATPTSSPTSSPTVSPTASQTQASQASTPVSASGDPHLVNLLGERFDVTKVGVMEFLRVPYESVAGEANFTVFATIQDVSGSHDECKRALYITSARFGGAWLGDRRVEVSMHRGDMVVSLAGVRMKPSLQPVPIGNMLQLHFPREDQLHVRIGVASVDISRDIQRASFFLNMRAASLGNLGYKIGGLLGEDTHDYVSKAPSRCQVSMLATPRETSRSVASASLTD